MAVSPEILGLVSLGALFVGIFAGFPISFTLIFLAIVFGYIGFGKVVFYLMVLQTFIIMREPLLAAVPLFLFMGYILEQAGLMDRLFSGFRLMLASVKGSLYIAVLTTATLFAAATGIVGASVTILGVMAAPIMKKSGYDPRLSAGSIAAGGTLGMLIPPSVMLVVMGPVVGVPITELFAAAVLPGILLAGLYTVYAVVRCHMRPELGPAMPEEERAGSAAEIVRELFVGIIPLAVLILAVLGSILGGLATPTDAAAMGAMGAFLLALAYRRLTWDRLKTAVFRTIVTSSMILLLVAASNFYGAVFARLGSATMIAEALLAFELSPTILLLLILGVIFLLGWPLEWVPIVLNRHSHPAAGDRAARRGPGVVLHAGRGLPANRLAVSTRCALGLLHQGRGPGLGPEGHLPGHDAVHGGSRCSVCSWCCSIRASRCGFPSCCSEAGGEACLPGSSAVRLASHVDGAAVHAMPHCGAAGCSGQSRHPFEAVTPAV